MRPGSKRGNVERIDHAQTNRGKTSDRARDKGRVRKPPKDGD